VKRFLRFLQATLVGGLLFLLPIIVVVMITEKALAIADKIIFPLAAHIPIKSVIGLETPKFLAIALLILFCFLSGFFARTAIAKKAIHWLETSVLANLPGYEFLKNTFASSLGVESGHEYKVILAWINGSWQLAFLIELIEGGYVAAFVPNAPNPQSGSIIFVSEEMTRVINISSAEAIKCLRRVGAGSNKLLRGKLDSPVISAK